MKKIPIVVMILFVAFSLPTQSLNAQDIGMNFYINFGVVTDDSFKFDYWLWSGGAQLDIHIGSFFMITPECDIIIYRFEFDPVILAPGVLANFKLSNFFIGAGVAYWGVIGTGVGPFEGEALLKTNVGLRTSNLKITLYAITTFDNVFEDMAIGITLGFGF